MLIGDFPTCFEQPRHFLRNRLRHSKHRSHYFDLLVFWIRFLSRGLELVNEGPRLHVLFLTFRSLGCSIPIFCEAFTRTKINNAKKLLNRLPQLADAQVALKLLKECGGSCKMIHTMRCTPPHLISSALAEFDAEVRSTFSEVTGLMPDDEQWAQATRGLRHAGLGFRKAACHAPAAYLASVGSSQFVSKELFPEYHMQTLHNEGSVRRAVEQFNTSLPAERHSSASDALNSE